MRWPRIFTQTPNGWTMTLRYFFSLESVSIEKKKKMSKWRQFFLCWLKKEEKKRAKQCLFAQIATLFGFQAIESPPSTWWHVQNNVFFVDFLLWFLLYLHFFYFFFTFSSSPCSRWGRWETKEPSSHQAIIIKVALFTLEPLPPATEKLMKSFLLTLTVWTWQGCFSL